MWASDLQVVALYILVRDECIFLLLFSRVRDIVINIVRLCDIPRLILGGSVLEDSLVLKGWPHLSLGLRLGCTSLSKHVARSEALRELLLGTVESSGLIVLHGFLLLHWDGRWLPRLPLGFCLIEWGLLQLLGLERIEDLIGCGHSSGAWSLLSTYPSICTPV